MKRREKHIHKAVDDNQKYCTTMYIVGALNHNGYKINDTDDRVHVEQR